MSRFSRSVPLRILRKQLLLYTTIVCCCWTIGYYQYSLAWCFWVIPFMFYWNENLTEHYIFAKALERETETLLHPDYESADWVNKVIRQLWLTYPHSISTVLSNVLVPILKKSKPFLVKDVTIHRLVVGKKPPKVKTVKAYSQKISDDIEDHKDIVVDVQLQSKSELEIVLHVYLVGVNTPVAFLVSEIDLDCWVRLNMKLDPENDKQFFEYIQVSTLSEPTLLLSVQPLSSSAAKDRKKTVNLPDLMQVPLLREWLNFTFVTELLHAMNFPNYIELGQSEFKIFFKKDVSEGAEDNHGSSNEHEKVKHEDPEVIEVEKKSLVKNESKKKQTTSFFPFSKVVDTLRLASKDDVLSSDEKKNRKSKDFRPHPFPNKEL